MKPKVIVIDRCEYCDGEAYLYTGKYKDGDVERPVYLPGLQKPPNLLSAELSPASNR